MSISLINTIITEGWVNPTGGGLFKVPVASIIIEEGVGDAAGELVKELGLGRSYIVVSDAITYELLGKRIEKGLSSLGAVVSLVLPVGVKADSRHVTSIIEFASTADVVVAVGSGTINDLCKYASFLMGKPYVVFGTAPSMNGYASANASITVEGHKKSLPCHLPHAIFLDIAVLSEAPKRLIRSGLGDSLCRPTAQADWLLSHLLFETPYSEVPFVWLKSCEDALFQQSKALVAGDKEVLRLLCCTLVLSGLGMVISGGSYPASQGEHLISHTMEMACEKSGVVTTAYHGEQIAVSTLTMASLQHRFLKTKPILRETIFPRCEMVGFLGKDVVRGCREEFAIKKMGKRKVEAANERIDHCWEAVKGRLVGVMLSEERLLGILKDAGVATTPEAIGWQLGQYQKAVRYASFTRQRFTFLDILRLSFYGEGGV